MSALSNYPPGVTDADIDNQFGMPLDYEDYETYVEAFTRTIETQYTKDVEQGYTDPGLTTEKLLQYDPPLPYDTWLEDRIQSDKEYAAEQKYDQMKEEGLL